MTAHTCTPPYEALERARRGAAVPAPRACLCGPPWCSLVAHAGITEAGLAVLASRPMAPAEAELLVAIARARGRRQVKPHERAALQDLARWGLVADSNAERVGLTVWGRCVLMAKEASP